MNKNSLKPLRNSGRRAFVWLLSFLIFFGLAEGQVLVNCLVAMVDETPVSLYDLKIVDLFGLEPELALVDRPLKKEDLVNIYINELLVVNLAREQINLSQEEIDQEIEKVKASLGSQNFEDRCQILGLGVEELIPYVENKLLFEKIVNSRFSQRVHISLQELENYYNDVYVPEVKTRGQPVPEMVNVLNEIENRLQAIKARDQLARWMTDLREKARIIINYDCLDKVEIKEQEEK
ncbi:MAG TPA: hypothetical protein PLW30_08085 [Candidatus Saccharicenans sp.]|jgi:hypothetical protein|nr:hypothetical protein [Candidatus Saccharicenans sp.]HOT69615.1 hypothetical protein [Candidatus Saccharicenans sp.]HQE65076.1 hypothetical protein [Candidatus Saccharicenans sp.]HQH61891.1 hypothetical protein [Candidatus Saccharicenans sp.]